MGKNNPITNKIGTRLVFKKVVKFWKSKRFFYASSSQSNGSINRSVYFYLLKQILKRLAFLHPDSTTTAFAQTQDTVSAKIKSVPTTSAQIKVKKTTTPLYGWSLRPLFTTVRKRILQLPHPSFAIPSLPSIHTPVLPLFQISRPKFGLLSKIKPSSQIKTSWWQITLAIILLATLSSGYAGYNFIFKDLPTPDQLTRREQIVTTRILDRNGQVLYRIYEDENRTPVALAHISKYMQDATLAIEDKNFFYHHGFSLRGIVRAAIANSKGQTFEQGGSTITQQLVKNRLLSSEKTVERKLKELVLSLQVENTYSKEEILEMYLNQVAYGGATYGIEEAAHRYFGKSAQDLNLAESSMLAGLPVAPSVYSPFSSNPELAKQRQYEVLRRMVEDGYILQEEADAAFAEQLSYQNDVINIEAPHFVMYVKKLLAEQYGEAAVNQGGLEVRTSLDLDLQTEAQEIVTTEVQELERLNVSNGAALVTNPSTGEILAMVGSTDYFDFTHDGQVNVTLRPRQPGSSIKPLTYSLALSQGMSPSTIIEDSPVTYQTAGSPPYSPVNYDGRFHGKVSLREALASSYNVPAVKLLAQVGVSSMLDQAQAMGIDTWTDRRRFGLSLTLGGGEVRMVDMAELYSTFANYGYTVELNPILEVKNYRGDTLYRNTCALDGTGCPKTKTLDSQVAYQITDILSDNKARTPAFGPQSVLYIPNQQVAVKTGTTNNLRDNWTIGYTTDRLVATWVGNNDNTSMSYVASGITGASPIWNKIIRLTLDPDQSHVFATPKGMVRVQICAPTGTLPCSGCPEIKEALFAAGTEPTQQCSPKWFTPQPSQQPIKRDQILQGQTSSSTSH